MLPKKEKLVTLGWRKEKAYCSKDKTVGEKAYIL